jgi:hypothetical protein
LVAWLTPAGQHNREGVAALLETNRDRFDPLASCLKAIRTIRIGESLGDYMALPGMDPAANDNELLHTVVCWQRQEDFQGLLQSGRVDPGDRDGMLLAVIVDRDWAKLLSPMLKHADQFLSANSNFAIRLAIRKKDLTVVKRILCKARMRSVDPNIPIYADGTLLVEAVRSGSEQIVSHLLGFPKFALLRGDLENAKAQARKMGNVAILAQLEAATGQARPAPAGNAWRFSVDPARILLWGKASIAELHAFHLKYGCVHQVKPIAAMVRHILAGCPAQEHHLYRHVAGIDLLQLAYDDFMQSRPELSEGERRDLFVRVIRLQTCRLRLH